MYIFTGILLLSLLVLFDARKLGLEKGQMLLPALRLKALARPLEKSY